MFMMDFLSFKICILFTLTLKCDCEWYRTDDDVPYLPDFYGSSVINYEAYDLYSSSNTLSNLNLGQTVETFDEIMLEKFLNLSSACDIQQEDDEQNLLYSPSICTKAANCLAPTDLGKRSRTVCRELAQGRGGGTCCPAVSTKWYKDRFKPERLFHWREMHQVKLRPETVIMGKSRKKMVEADYDKIADASFAEKLKLGNVQVCGILPHLSSIGENSLYTPYFCKPKRNCAYSRHYPERPLWHDFCNNRFSFWFSGVAPLGSNEGEEACCHLDKAGGFNPLPNLGVELTSWKFPHMPLVFQYAPGVRSSYACELYEYTMCSRNIKTCTDEGEEGYLSKIEGKDFPHVARLGIVAPKVMLFFCMGTIISRRYILSVWQCREKHGIGTNVALLGDDGSPRLLNNVNKEDIYLIAEVIDIHDRRDWPTGRHHVALYRTAEDIRFNEYVRPACLFHQPDRQTKGAFVGLAENLESEDQIDGERHGYRYVSLPIVGRTVNHYGDEKACFTDYPYDEELNHYYAEIESPQHRWGEDPSFNIFCAGDPTLDSNLNPCGNELGSSLTVKLATPPCQWQVIGMLVSNRLNCSEFLPGVFVNVTRYIEIIEDIVWPYPFLKVEVIRPLCTNYKGYWTEYTRN